MSATASLQNLAASPKALSHSNHAGLLLQRKCACGSPTSSLTGECAECKSKKRLQAKLTIGASNDPLEQEADRVADQVLAAPANPAVSGAPPRIQRFMGQPSAVAGTAPASVDRVLASPGRPLEPALRQDMEQRLGHDFARVRVHADAAAGKSAQDVNANAYTVGHDIVFGASRFAPTTHGGRRLIAHELTHVVQQSGAVGMNVGMTLQRAPIKRPDIKSIPLPATHSEVDDPGASDPARDDAVPMSKTAVSEIVANIGPTGKNIAHVPPCLGQPQIWFTAKPSSAAPVTWSIGPGSTVAAASGTALTPATNTLTATLALGSAQKGGILDINADNSEGGQLMQYRLASHPIAIASTSPIGDPVDTTQYGGVFNHAFVSHDGKASSLEEVFVGERFPKLPTPNAATHTFPTPFGTATLTTGTLPNIPSGAAGDWLLTSTGELGGNMDTVRTPKAAIDIGKHLTSDSNPSPANLMPVEFVVDQEFHWWCPHTPAGKRWAHAADTTQTHRLRMAKGGVDAEFVAIVNSKENAMPYEGITGVTNARAVPPTVTPSAAGNTANTVQIEADALPTGRALHFSIRGNAHGCTIDHATGELTIGGQAGTVKVRAANKNNGSNWDEVDVTITAPATQAPSPSPAAPGTRPVQRERVGDAASNAGSLRPMAAPDIAKVLDSSGSALQETVRRFMERRLGASFEDVRIHADAPAERTARALAARAYMTGSHVVFGEGEYQPGSSAGQRLLAHELAHVVQQRRSDQGPSPTNGSAAPPRNDRTSNFVVNPPSDRYEQEADRVAEQVARAPSHESARPIQLSVDGTHQIQRQPDEIEMPVEDLNQAAVVPAIVKSRRGDTDWIKDASKGPSLDEAGWNENRADTKKLVSDAAQVAQVAKVFVGATAVANVADNINILDVRAKARYLPGLNFSASLMDRGETAYVAAAGGDLMDKLTPSRTDALPKVAIVLSAQALSSKSVALGVLRHEMVHVEHLNLALRAAKKWIDSKTKSSFEDWLDEQHDKGRMTSLDLELSKDAANARSANTELLAYTEGFMTAFLLAQPALGDNDDAAFLELYGMITSSTEPWANANVPARQEALGRLQEYYCHVLDQPHKVAFERFILKPRGQQTTKARAWTWAPKRQMHQHFYAGLKTIIDAKCAPLGGPKTKKNGGQKNGGQIPIKS